MTNKIKEILKDMDLVANHNKVPIYYTQNQIKLLLDYITDLQEEITGLDIALDSGVKNIKEKQQRIDKAIKYIENDIDLTGINGFEKLLDILRGDE